MAAKDSYTISGIIRDQTTNRPLPGLLIKAFDADLLSEDDYLGDAQTDTQGRFIIRYRKANFVKGILEAFLEGGPDLYLRIYAPDGTLLHTTTERSGASRFEEYDLAVPAPTPPKVGLDTLLGAAAVIADTNAVVKRLQEMGVQDSFSLLSAAKTLKAEEVGLDEASLQRLLRVAKLHAASGSIALAGKLAGVDEIHTFTELAGVPQARLEKILGKLGDEERVALDQLHAMAGLVRRHVVNHAAAKQREKSRDGQWHPGWEKPGKPDLGKDWLACKDCDPWENVFSPRAYLFDLLDLIYSHWQVSTATLEKLFFQEIDELGEVEAYATVPQVELAVEVLEKYLKATGVALPIGDAALAEACIAAWRSLLDDVTKHRLSGTLVRAIDTKVEHLANQILNVPPDLDSIRCIRNLLIWSSETGGPDPAIAALSPSYGQGGTAFAASLAATYTRILVLYRDALIKQSGDRHPERLPEKLFFDLQAQPCGMTNRLTRLILSLQSFILAVRSGDIADFTRADLLPDLIHELRLKPAIPVEEADWRWLQDFQTWASAMYTLLYPENVLMPPLFDEGYSDAFMVTQKTLATGRADREDTCEAYAKYLFDWSMPDVLRVLTGEEDVEESGRFSWQPPEVDSDWLERKVAAALASFRHEMSHAATKSLDDMVTLGTKLWNRDWWFEKFTEMETPCERWRSSSNVISVGRDAPRYMCFPWESGSVENPEIYLDPEIYLHFPLLAAWALNRSGEYAAAHDWYRRLYDPMRPRGQRHVFPFGQHFNDDAIRSEQWWDDVLDPRQIAERRTGVYLRHAILAMVKNLLDWADHEYALARPESIDRARELYDLARRVLQAPDLADRCGRAIRELELDIVTGVRPEIQRSIPDLQAEIDRLCGILDPDILRGAVKDFGALLPGVREPGDIDPIQARVGEALNMDRAARPTSTLGQQRAEARFTLAAYEDEFLFAAGAQKPAAPSSTTPVGGTPAPFFFLTTPSLAGGLGIPTTGGPIHTSVTFCVPANPLLKALSFYIEVSLIKLRHCLSIAGEPLPVSSLPTTAVEVLDTITGEAARRTTQGTMNMAWDPPRYRYAYLADKARQYADNAQRLGSALLLAYEKREAEGYLQLLARQGLDLTKATVTLKDMMVDEAVTAKKVAIAQKDRVETQQKHWKELIDKGWSDAEIAGFSLTIASASAHGLAALVGGLTAAATGIAAGFLVATGAATAGTVVGGPLGTVIGGTLGSGLGAAAAAGAMAAIPGATGALSSMASALGTAGQAALTFASFERREQDWNFQLDLGKWDVKITGLQVTQAGDHIATADQDREITMLQQAHAEETLRFLETKFSNDKLYVWMIEVLGQHYRAVMQIAADVARQAQNALEFERQQAAEIITGDYWSLAAAGVPTSGLSEEQRESGLLGAERLLADLTRLDAYKLATERRQFQLSKTLSMAQLMPSELVKLRTECTVTFNTLMGWFDLDFPGHYLRLIKSVRVSVLCLASPVDGIHAMLHNGGESSVVVRDLSGAFVKRRVLRTFPESIALDAAYNESGLFVMDYNDPLFLPFESLGVETQWTLELPRATNRFDFNTIVDVMLTIDYTAYHDTAYAKDVRGRYQGAVTADVMLDLHAQYPDEWYHFRNPVPDSSDTERTITVKLEPTALPRNFKIEDPMRVRHLTVLLVGDLTQIADSTLSAVKVAKEDVNGIEVTFSFATSTVAEGHRYALLSTRQTGSQPDGGLGDTLNPDGEWNITVADAGLADLLNDIVLAVTVEGKLDWGAV